MELTISILLIWATALCSLFFFRPPSYPHPLESPNSIILVIVLIYGTLPPIWWILQGGEYISPNSGRLFVMQPSYFEQLNLTLFALFFSLGIFVAQLIFKNYASSKHSYLPSVVTRQVLIVSAMLIGIFYLFDFLLVFFGLIGAKGEYGIQYREVQQLPLLLAQIYKILASSAFFLKIVVLLWLFQQRNINKFILLIPLALSIIFFDTGGSRSGLFLIIFIYLILLNRYIYMLSIYKLSFISIILIICFTFFGFYRGVNSGAGLDISLESILGFGLGEFDILWGNAVELRRLAIDGTEFPISLYFSELYSAIPSYLLPFDKLSYSIWYLDEYYPEYKEAGGGNMFGLLAQVSIGFGLFEAFIRGLILGSFIIFLVKFLRKSLKWWAYPTIIYITVWIFYSVRDSSFSILNNILQTVIPTILIVSFMSKILLKDVAHRDK